MRIINHINLLGTSEFKYKYDTVSSVLIEPL